MCENFGTARHEQDREGNEADKNGEGIRCITEEEQIWREKKAIKMIKNEKNVLHFKRSRKGN